nr:uncharacterized protein LOC119161097 [Rhipicephalus microplus]
MASLQLPDYDETKDKWKPYLVRAEAYFEANSVTDPAKKRALLVSALSSKTVEVLAGRVAPRAPNELTYKEVVQSLNEYYDPKKHEITESYKFFNRSQLPGESVSAFLVAIRRIADNCNFGTSLDRMLRDRIVCGVRSVALRKQMLAKKDLTLEEAEALALSVEAAENGAESMTSEATPLLKLRASEANTVKTSPTRHAAQHCDRCGSSKHDGNSCRWIRARCYRCGRHGHLAKMCRTTASKSRVATHAVEGRALTLEEAVTEDDDKDETHIWTLLSARKSRLEPPIRRSFSWNGVQLTMEVDTGSPVCVISKNVFDKHREQWPALKPSQVKLSCYVGPLPVMGELQLCVQYRAVSVYCRLIVLNCSGPNLCGRDLISLLHRAGVPVLQPSAQDLLHSTPEPAGAVHNIVDDYHDVFSKDLGLIKGPPATLQLKEGAVPKFCRQFTLVTDHQPLLSLLQSDRPTPPLAAARIQRWALYLGGYRYKLQYTPGKQLLNADALSRLPLRSTEADDVDSPPASDDWVVPIESNVYVRNYGVGEKWTPGRVQSTAGSRMVTVQTPHSVVRRHVDQVRPRQVSQSPSPGSASLSESNMSMLPKRSPGPSTTSSTVLPPEALTTASPHDHPVPTMPQAGPTQAATPSAEPVLRRSTRQRKPVQRFHF